MKILPKLALTALFAFAVLQAIRPAIPTHPATAEVQAPPAVRQILEKGCYSCHSDQRRLSWFDQIVPGYWLVRHDILKARRHLNFSTLGSQPAAAQRATLFEAVNMVQLGAMPLPQFIRLHPEARLTPADLTVLKDFLAPWSTPPAPATTPSPATPSTDLQHVQTGFANVPFDPTFETWKLVSTTDRGDNNTFRFILGNDIAIKAIQSGSISPWPDGARLAKVAWQQQQGTDGLVHPGKFIQVELMVKDAARYKNTEGWGWGRWRGLDLKPYGKNAAAAVNECTSCHLPVKGNDYVYTLPITPATLARQEVVNNHAAALPSTLPWQPLGWTPITLYVDRNAHTASTLFGNEAAATWIKNPTAPLPSGAVLALVTWAQREDPHWFGARIPDSPKSVEFLTASAYRLFAGPTLAEATPPPSTTTERTTFVLNLRPVPLP